MSKRYSVDVITPPYLDQVRLVITPLAFTGLPEQILDGGDAEILRGSQLTVQAFLAAQWLRCCSRRMNLKQRQWRARHP